MTLDNWDHGEVDLGDGGRREAPEAGVGDEAQVLVFVAASSFFMQEFVTNRIAQKSDKTRKRLHHKARRAHCFVKKNIKKACRSFYKTHTSILKVLEWKNIFCTKKSHQKL